jgi:hypothetical protein
MTEAQGVPTERSKRCKANQQLQESIKSIATKEKISSTSTISGNDVLPSPKTLPLQPMTQAEGEQRAFETARVLLLSLLNCESVCPAGRPPSRPSSRRHSRSPPPPPRPRPRPRPRRPRSYGAARRPRARPAIQDLA